MHSLAGLVADNADDLPSIESRDNGKLLREMSGQMAALLDWYGYFAGAAAAQWITVGNTINSASALNVGLVTHLRDLTNADVETIALELLPSINQRRARQVAALMNRPEPGVGLADLAMSINLSTDLKAQMLTYINLRLRDRKD